LVAFGFDEELIDFAAVVFNIVSGDSVGTLKVFFFPKTPSVLI